MNIIIGKYTLTSDNHQFVVEKTKVKKIADQITTYHSSLESALENILKRKIRMSKAKILEDLVDDIKKFQKEIVGYLNVDIKIKPRKLTAKAQIALDKKNAAKKKREDKKKAKLKAVKDAKKAKAKVMRKK